MARRNLLRLCLSFSALVVLLFFPTGAADLASDMAALVALQKAMGARSRTRQWNLSDETPCLWFGVICGGGRVTELRLPGVGLFGQLPLGLGNLTHLETLSLRSNMLSGSIPSDFANLRSLRNLYLQRNSFSSEIPSVLFSIQSLVRLNLAHNQFVGPISSVFNNLTNLEVLNLEGNQLDGFIPDLNIPSLKTLNVSFNRLNGSIPTRLSDQPASVFDGNSLCGKPLSPCQGEEKKLSTAAIVGIVIGGSIAFLIIGLILIFLCRKRNRINRRNDAQMTTRSEVRNGGGGNGGIRNQNGLVFCGKGESVFDLEELLKASAEVLGKGAFGSTYKAALDMGMTMAVKRLRDVKVSEEEFMEKIESLGMMNHQNLVPIKAYYYGRDEKLLVCDYAPMGSLSLHLHGNKDSGRTPLKWEARVGIMLSAGRGISYLHSRRPPTSHGNIKPSNILLNRSHTACVSDFGLIQIASPTPTSNHTVAYRAPEVTDPRKVSLKADVYSLGVVILELLTGKTPNSSMLNDDGVDLPRWVKSKVNKKKTAEVFDEELLGNKNGSDEMIQLLNLAMLCTDPYPDNRPSMAKVTSRIDEIYHSILLKEQEMSKDKFYDVDSAVSQQFYSADSIMVPPSI
ncbi:putative inactive receptor kinase [Cucurbita argyrosperma subsp. argyrosperma]|nr:putative inactive receptor kinase [Cucurbita argyrosperma subsp. argyrosperma]